MAAECAQQLATARLPQLHGLVRTPAGQRLAIRTQATEETAPKWPLSVRSSWPPPASHSFTVWSSPPLASVLSAETIESVTGRAMAAIEALRERYPAREIVVVCHGAVIQSICAYTTGVWSKDHPPNCGLVTIEYDAQGWRAPVKSGNWSPLTGLHSARVDGFVARYLPW